MHFKRLDPAQLEEAYGVRVQELYPWKGVVEPPFGAAWAVVPPGGRTKHHSHQEGETFFFARGHGRMRIGEEVREVAPGDVVFQPPFESHVLENVSATEELVFLTVWWEDLDLWAQRRAGKQAQAAGAAARPVRTLVTAAPPTPNGDLHLGHLSGPYLAGDVLRRALRLQGIDAAYVFGTDDNTNYVQHMGRQLGIGGAEAADHFAGEIAATLAAAEIEADLFTRPNASASHVPFVQEFFRRLYEQGHLIEREDPAPWCDTCGLYLHEALLHGGCPHCGAPTGGNFCEECGRPNACNLVAAACTRCGSAPSWRPTRRLYFPLSRWEGLLREHFQKVAMSPGLRSLCESALEAGLPDLVVAHRSDWGIPVPVAGWEGWTIWVWFEMAPRYLAYAEDLERARGGEAAAGESGWERWWKSEQAQVVQCFGFDNGFYYGVLIPALLGAFDPEIRLPAAYVMNEFYRLEGRKFSTSRRHAIWGRDLIPAVPADVMRFYLAWSSPEVESTNFNREELAATVRRELVGSWQEWLAELAQRVEGEAGGRVPATGDWLADHRRFYERLRELAAEVAAAYDPRTFSLQGVTRALAELVRTARRFARAEEGWRRVSSRGEERRTGIALELLAAKLLALGAYPLMPGFAARLWSDLGYEEPIAAQRWEERPSWVPAGQRVAGLASAPYFEDVAAALAAATGPREEPTAA